VSRGVYLATRENVLYCSELGSKLVVLARHPADRIVAQFCMRFKDYNKKDTGTVDIETWFESMFRGSGRFQYVDALWENLEWLRGWLRYNDQDDILIVRYEDMMRDFNAHFSNIHDFLFNAPMSVELKEALDKIFQRSMEDGDIRSGDLEARHYPKGYSGKVGIWRDYLTPLNVETYNNITHKMLGTGKSKSLLRLYPNLLLSD